MLKLCKVCGQERVFDPTAKKDRKASGFMGQICWDCYLAQDKKRCAELYATEAGKAKIQATNKVSGAKWRAKTENRLRHIEATLAWQKENREVCAAATAKYRAGKDQRTPSWADLAKIELIYKLAQELGLEVDHIVPLHGATVSGLHVENNLQLLSRKENAAKGNRWEH